MNEQVSPPKKKAYLKNLTLIIVAFSAAFFGWSALREGKFSGTAAMFFLQNYKITSGNSK